MARSAILPARVSKKKFQDALRLVKAGQLAAAVEALAGVDRAFIRKRLTHHKAQPPDREAALQLEEQLGAVLAPSSSAPTEGTTGAATFLAPLAPATVDEAPSGSISVDDPISFLRWASADWTTAPALQMASLKYAEIWSLVALGALCQEGRTHQPPIDTSGTSPALRFAHALGLNQLAGGSAPTSAEPDRTVKLTRVESREQIEPIADQMSRLLIRDEAAHDIRLAVRYVLVELLRNVIQHSKDPLGAVTAAQRMDVDQKRTRNMIQLAVADAGIGIPRALRQSHPHLSDYRQALERALLPHISGTFEEGLSGSFENAGLGLYMISELARQTQGRLLIATWGAALVLEAREGSPGVPVFLNPRGMGFPGTLVAFEIPTDAVQDYHALMQSILRKARERTPQRAQHRWLAFADPGNGATRVVLSDIKEDTLKAATLARDVIGPSILAKAPVVLDFAGLELCTQSFLHALLFEPVRIAWALRVPIHVIHADPAVAEGLRFLESYALGG